MRHLRFWRATGRKTGFHFCWSRSLRSSPPKRFFGLAHDIAPGETNVMQVAIGPSDQFAALALTVAPNVEGFAELGQNARIMMIYHRFM
jgi:hypothetical protein